MDDDNENVFAKVATVITGVMIFLIIFILLLWGLHSVWTGFIHSLG